MSAKDVDKVVLIAYTYKSIHFIFLFVYFS